MFSNYLIFFFYSNGYLGFVSFKITFSILPKRPKNYYISFLLNENVFGIVTLNIPKSYFNILDKSLTSDVTSLL